MEMRKMANAGCTGIVIAFVRSLILVVVVLVVAGCSTAVKHPEKGVLEKIPNHWTFSATINELPITSNLLSLINSNQVNLLVHEALNNNPDLHATAQRLKASGLLSESVGALRYPVVNADYEQSRTNQATDPFSGEKIVTGSKKIGLAFNWELDLWGRLSDEYRASQKTYEAHVYDYKYAMDALATRVIQTWIGQIAIRKTMSVNQERLNNLRDMESIQLERYKGGIGNLDELSSVRSRIQPVVVAIQDNQAEINRSVRKLEVLLGRYPEGKIDSGTQLPIIARAPVKLPAETLLKRPDVQAAILRLEAARKASDASSKAQLPDLRLSGQIFKQAASLNNLGDSFRYWGILGSIFQPLFDAGRLNKEKEAKETEVEASISELRQTILVALKEVEDVFEAEEVLCLQRAAIRAALRESVNNRVYYQDRYRKGLEPLQGYLEAREHELEVMKQLDVIETEILKNRVDMALAVGVGIEGVDVK